MPHIFLVMTLIGAGAGVFILLCRAACAAGSETRNERDSTTCAAPPRCIALAVACAARRPAAARRSRRRRRSSKVDAARSSRSVNNDLVELNREINAAGWTQSTYITVDTQYLNARVTERYLEYFSRKAGEAKAYDNDKLDAADRALAAAASSSA